MENRKLLKSSLLLMFFFLMTGCRNPFPVEKTTVQEENLDIGFNSDLELVRIVPIGANQTFQAGIEIVSLNEDIYFDLVNISDNTIQFPPDGGAYYFLYNKGEKEWVQVEDRRINLSTEPQVLLPKNNPDYLSGFYNVTPQIPSDFSNETLIPFRIVVIGKIIDHKSQTIGGAGAFYDLYLKND